MKWTVSVFRLLCLLVGLSQCVPDNQVVLPKDVNVYRFPQEQESPFFVLQKDSAYEFDFRFEQWCFIRAKNNEVFGFVSCDDIGVRSEEGSLTGLHVVVDAGHGGLETGASYFGIAEKDINAAVAKYLATALHDAGATVVMTRKADETVRLYTRPSYANLLGLLTRYAGMNEEEKKTFSPILLQLQEIIVSNSSHIPSLYEKHPVKNEISSTLSALMTLLHPVDDIILVSIHANATKDQTLGFRGTEIIVSDNRLAIEFPGYHHIDEDKRNSLQNALQASFKNAKVLPWRKSYVGNYAILRESNLPSVLIELGYMNHEEDIELLKNSKAQKELALAIFDGISAWYQDQDSDND